MKKKLNRRDFCQHSLLSATALALPTQLIPFEYKTPVRNKGKGPTIIDSNVHLMAYPFRHLKYNNTSDLVQKLSQHNISQAWAGSFEFLFHKNIDLANQRLKTECEKYGSKMLLPVGSVNTTWPDWEEDLRRCRENYNIDIIRIYPIYQMISMDDPDFLRFLELATQYKMIIQIVGDMEDKRHHHPLLEVRNISFEPLLDACLKIPEAKIQLVHWNRRVNFTLLAQLIQQTKVVFDISRIEGAGEVGGLIHGTSWYGMETKLPIDRLIFGSHAPYFPVESALLKLFESPLSEDEMISIMNTNADRFLNT